MFQLANEVLVRVFIEHPSYYSYLFLFCIFITDGIWTQILSRILSCISVTVYYLFIQNSMPFFYKFFTEAGTNMEFIKVIDLLTNLYLRSFFLVMPILTWGKGRSLRTHIDHWRQFQVKTTVQFLWVTAEIT